MFSLSTDFIFSYVVFSALELVERGLAPSKLGRAGKDGTAWC